MFWKQLQRWGLVLVLFGGLLGLPACEEASGVGVMTEEEMVPVLKDLHIAYAGVDVTVRNPKQRPEKYKEMNDLIIQKHGIDRQNFYDSYEYYQSQPALMDSIYQKVIDGLNSELSPATPSSPPRPPAGAPKNQ